MKKALLLVLALVLCFALVGCGDNNENVSGENNVVEPSTGNNEQLPAVSGEDEVAEVVSGEVIEEVSGEVMDVVSGEAE